MNGQRRPKYARVAVAIVVSGIIAATGFLVSPLIQSTKTVEQITTTTKTVEEQVTTTTTQILPCTGQQVWNSSSVGYSSPFPVLLMQPSSTGYICVTYRPDWRIGNIPVEDYPTTFPKWSFSLQIAKANCTTSGGGGVSCTNDTISHSFQVSASPSSIQTSNDTDYVTVVYTISALSNSTGFYDKAVPLVGEGLAEGGCSVISMAVGYPASQVNASDFSQFPPGVCNTLLSSYPVAVSVSVTGMTFTDILF
jgi:hypothetical protein